MKFQDNFMWGTASAAYQVEGAYLADGKGLNIWDAYCQEGNHIAHGENGNVACDHYHHFKDDVKMMKKMGIRNYRFSISWTRVLPDGTGKVNQKVLQFYSDLVDELLANGIEPLVTLFHWDYPLALHQKGGWLNRDSSDWFAEYAKVVVDALSDRVKYWMTINEPQVFIGCGYAIGKFAPLKYTRQRSDPYDTRSAVPRQFKSFASVAETYRRFCLCDPAAHRPTIHRRQLQRQSRKPLLQRIVSRLNCPGGQTRSSSEKYPEDAYKILGDDMPEI
ncbi:MAG: glycoside hydrolase family 1 protein [Ruminococcus callidus]